MSKIYWTAKNNSNFLNRSRSAKTLIGAVRAARKYVDGELYGEGKVSFFDNKDDHEPIRTDEKSIFTGFKWATRE